MDELVFHSSPEVRIASNSFINVPVILQYDEQPLISVTKTEEVNFTTEVPIYHSDGTYLAKVRGNRIYPTEEGEKADVEVRKLPDVWVCNVEGRTAFEIRQQSGNAFRTDAELYTPDGRLVKVHDSPKPDLIDKDGQALEVGGLTMTNSTIQNMAIGIWVHSDGGLDIGVSHRAV